jgi:hypothetical protein
MKRRVPALNTTLPVMVLAATPPTRKAMELTVPPAAAFAPLAANASQRTPGGTGVAVICR